MDNGHARYICFGCLTRTVFVSKNGAFTEVTKYAGVTKYKRPRRKYTQQSHDTYTRRPGDKERIKIGFFKGHKISQMSQRSGRSSGYVFRTEGRSHNCREASNGDASAAEKKLVSPQNLFVSSGWRWCIWKFGLRFWIFRWQIRYLGRATKLLWLQKRNLFHPKTSFYHLGGENSERHLFILARLNL